MTPRTSMQGAHCRIHAVARLPFLADLVKRFAAVRTFDGGDRSRRRPAEGPGQTPGKMLKIRGALPGARKVPQARREHASLALDEAPRKRKPEPWPLCAGDAQVELGLGDAQQHVRVGPQIAELVHLVAPSPRSTEVRG